MGRNRKSNRGNATTTAPATLETALVQKSALHQMRLAFINRASGDAQLPIVQQVLALNSESGVNDIENIVYPAYDALKQTISRLSPADQQTLFDQTVARRINPENVFESFSNDATMFALVLYGTPAIRWEALTHLRDYPLKAHTLSTENAEVRVIANTDINRLSLDQLLYMTLRNIGIDSDDIRNIDVTNPTAIQDQFGEEMFDVITSQFMRNFSSKHAGANNNLCGAAMNTALAKIGENQDVRTVPSFYPKDVDVPAPTPLILALLQRQYERTQRAITQATVPLYRGSRKLNIGIPMSPWTTNLDTAKKHTGKTGVLYSADIPKRFIFMMHTDPNFMTDFPMEQEYLILESGLKRQVKKRTSTTIDGYNNGVILDIGK